MVDFGLKLEDNKVSEWTDNYIDYEALKKILKAASAEIKRRDDLMRRKPQVAEAVLTQYREGNPTPHPSQTDLQKIASGEGGDQVSAESKPLLQQTNEKYGSKDSVAAAAVIEARSDSVLSNTIRRTMSGYFMEGNYEHRIRESLKEIDKLEGKFDECIHGELSKVNTFYFEQVEELRSRLSFLVESVHDEHGIKTKTHKKKRSNLSDFVFSRIQHIVHHDSTDTELTEVKVSLMDDDQDIQQPDNKLQESQLKESDSIQRAMTDMYRNSKLLHNFAIINYTGFVKIVKKHDKTFQEYKGKYKDMTAASSVCNEGSDVEKLSDRMERLYADWFCDGNLQIARAQLLPKKGDGLQMDWSQLRLGYRLGMCAILTIWVCWDCIWGMVAHKQTTIGGRTAFPVFRACGGLVLLHWFWGISTYVWNRYRINYIFLFDFNPNVVDSPLKIFNDAVDETLVFLISMLLYYKSGAHDLPGNVPPGVYPFLLVLYTIKTLIFPLRNRRPMWAAILEVITSPMTSPRFFTIYIGDVFTSMVKVFQDIAWTFGFVLSGDFLIPEDELKQETLHSWQHSVWYANILIPLICLFPLWMRFNQCLRRYLDSGVRGPNLLNALKYAMSQTVTLFGAFHPLYLEYNMGDAHASSLFQIFWLMLFLSSSLYSFVWDVYMDWGLGRPEYAFLGPRLMYPDRSYYYGVIAADLVLRSMWVLSLIPPQSGAKFEIPQYLTAVTMSLELFRRTIWSFFRLENEHRSNTGHYRRVNFVPLHFNTGHKHKYHTVKEHVGWTVLLEVAIVSVIVIGVSVSSVIAAQRATRGLLQPEL